MDAFKEIKKFIAREILFVAFTVTLSLGFYTLGHILSYKFFIYSIFAWVVYPVSIMIRIGNWSFNQFQEA